MTAPSLQARPRLGRRTLLAAPLVTPFVAQSATLFVALLTPRAVRAHAVLVGSEPAAGSTVPAGAVTFALRFNSRIDHARSRVELLGANGERPVLTIAPGGPPDTVSVTMIAAAGTNTIRWQVLAVDGHITRGEVVFYAVKQ